MENLYAVWIDHAHAFIVKANEEDVVSVTPLLSDVDPHRRAGTTEEHLTLSDQVSFDKHRNLELKHFCESILEHLKDANEIAILGPSTAKFELKKILEEDHTLSKKLIAVETTDKMTENQLKAYVIKLFELPRISAL